MSTSVNIGDDLKSYLSSSQPKKNGLGNMFGNGAAKSWLYSPLGSSEPDDVNNAANSDNSSNNGYFSGWFGRDQPEPENSWLPALVIN